MKIIDFESKFFEYVSGWLAMRPNMKPEEAEEHYNEMMLNWLNIPAKWLDGVKPGEYFNRYSEPSELMKLMEEYDKRDIALPEPLYARIVAVGSPCVEMLKKMAENPEKSEALRGTAVALLEEIGEQPSQETNIRLLLEGEAEDALADMASEALCNAADEALCDKLMALYDAQPEWTQDRILDICANGCPVHAQLYERILHKLQTGSEHRAYYAALLGKIGDARAIEPLRAMMQMQDTRYLEYIEIRNAIEMLGGEAGEEREFYGDEDYEALRKL